MIAKTESIDAELTFQTINIEQPSWESNSLLTPKIHAILYTVFEQVAGYAIRVSDPPDALSDEFKAIGYQFLPDKDVCGKVITLFLDSVRMMGVPVYISDEKYSRHSFIFCICIVVDGLLPDAAPFRDVCQHLADAFYTLETDMRFLSEQNNSDVVGETLSQIRQQLNSNDRKFVCVQIDPCHCINFELNLTQKSKETSFSELFSLSLILPASDLDSHDNVNSGEIFTWQIPMFVAQFQSLDGVDMIARQVIDKIDGFNSIRKISTIILIPESVVISIIYFLVSQGLVFVFDEVDNLSRFRLTSRFHQLVNIDQSSKFVTEMSRLITGGSNIDINKRQLILLYSSINGLQENAYHYIIRNESMLRELQVAPRLLFVYGLSFGLLKSLKLYTIVTNPHLVDATLVKIEKQLCPTKRLHPTKQLLPIQPVSSSFDDKNLNVNIENANKKRAFTTTGTLVASSNFSRNISTQALSSMGFDEHHSNIFFSSMEENSILPPSQPPSPTGSTFGDEIRGPSGQHDVALLNSLNPRDLHILTSCDGSCCADEICLKYGCSRLHFIKLVESVPSLILTIWKYHDTSSHFIYSI